MIVVVTVTVEADGVTVTSPAVLVAETGVASTLQARFRTVAANVVSGAGVDNVDDEDVA